MRPITRFSTPLAPASRPSRDASSAGGLGKRNQANESRRRHFLNSHFEIHGSYSRMHVHKSYRCNNDCHSVISVHAEPETSRRLSQLAKATRRSKSFLANEAIERYLAAEEKFAASVKRGIEQTDTEFHQRLMKFWIAPASVFSAKANRKTHEASVVTPGRGRPLQHCRVYCRR